MSGSRRCIRTRGTSRAPAQPTPPRPYPHQTPPTHSPTPHPSYRSSGPGGSRSVKINSMAAPQGLPSQSCPRTQAQSFLWLPHDAGGRFDAPLRGDRRAGRPQTARPTLVDLAERLCRGRSVQFGQWLSRCLHRITRNSTLRRPRRETRLRACLCTRRRRRPWKPTPHTGRRISKPTIQAPGKCTGNAPCVHWLARERCSRVHVGPRPCWSHPAEHSPRPKELLALHPLLHAGPLASGPTGHEGRPQRRRVLLRRRKGLARGAGAGAAEALCPDRGTSF